MSPEVEAGENAVWSTLDNAGIDVVNAEAIASKEKSVSIV